MSEQPIDANRMVERDASGRFLPGSVPNPKSNNQFTTIVPLLQAIEETSIKKDKPFWHMVAEKCYGSHGDALLIAILKKLLPDKMQAELNGNINMMPTIEKDGQPKDYSIGSETA